MDARELNIKGVWLFTPQVFSDDRGSFFESFRDDVFREKVGPVDFVQENQSISAKNVIRGLHFQAKPHQQGKLVRVVQGKALDIIVDLRPESPDFGKHISVELSDENNRQLWVPPGFAHGFASLSENMIFCYKCSAYYHQASDRVLLYNDNDLAIHWPIQNPILSQKDRNGIPFSSIINHL